MKILRQILPAIFILCFFFAGFEYLLRAILLHTQHEENYYTAWYQRARIIGWHLPRQGVINKLGFHNGPRNPIKGKNVFRIFILGGSAVYGTDRLDSNWGAQLEKELNSLGTKMQYEIWNGGVSGGTSHEDVKHLRNILELNPDLLIIYNGFNDTYASHYSPEGYQNRRPEYGASGDLVEVKRWLSRRSLAFIALERAATKMGKSIKNRQSEELATPHHPASPEAHAPGEENIETSIKRLNIWNHWYDYTIRPNAKVDETFSREYKRNLLEIYRMASRRKIPVVFILQPNLAYSAAVGEISSNARAILKRATNILYEDWINASAQLYSQAIRVMQELNQGGILAYDFTDIFKGIEDQGFQDSVHQPETGMPNELIAQKIFEILIKKHLIPAARQPGLNIGIDSRRSAVRRTLAAAALVTPS